MSLSLPSQWKPSDRCVYSVFHPQQPAPWPRRFNPANLMLVCVFTGRFARLQFLTSPSRFPDLHASPVQHPLLTADRTLPRIPPEYRQNPLLPESSARNPRHLPLPASRALHLGLGPASLYFRRRQLSSLWIGARTAFSAPVAPAAERPNRPHCDSLSLIYEAEDYHDVLRK